MTSPKRGDIFWVNLDPTIGSEMRKRRPCVVVSLSILNEKRLTVIVVPISTKGIPRPPLVVAAVTSAGASSNARIDQIHVIDKTRLIEKEGELDHTDMESVERGLRTVLGLS